MSEKMIVIIKNIAKCLLSPRLYNTHRHGPVDNLYQPKMTEAFGDTVITLASIIRDMSLYTSPLIAMYVYRRGILEDMHQVSNMFCWLSCIIVIAFLSRAWGRASNPEYMQFIKALHGPKNDMSLYLEEVRKFDFDFHAWPATYVTPSRNSNNSLVDQENCFVAKENEHLPLYQKYILKLLAYIAVNTFALRLIYPGSLGLIHYLLRTPLLQGRASLIEDYNGQRVKIVTEDGNSIDTMFVDNRSTVNNHLLRGGSSTKGHTLVICSEGNSGFYEVGIMMTPLKAGYSVLGWNHPGFAGSTGLPYPRQELAAMDAVLQYALLELKFPRDQIVLYGWSIGGYSAAWAACTYDTKALVLDATFDDLLALAVKQMPASWEPLVREVVRAHVDLDVARLLQRRRGHLHLVRRTQDEIICLSPGDISSNRGNDLLVKLIKHRHGDAELFDEQLLVRFANMLEADRNRSNTHGLDDKSKYILRLIATYSSDFRSTHCVPLPTEKFESVMTQLKQMDTRKQD